MAGCCCSAAQRRGYSLVRVNQVLRIIAIALGVLAVGSGVALLIKDAGVNILPGLPTSVISAAPLLLVAVAFLIAQPTMRPSNMELLKNLLLAATFPIMGSRSTHAARRSVCAIGKCCNLAVRGGPCLGHSSGQARWFEARIRLRSLLISVAGYFESTLGSLCPAASMRPLSTKLRKRRPNSCIR